MQASGQTVADKLLDWYDHNARRLPWRAGPGERRADPYRVWLSEVMLQQTTVAAVAPYFARFVERWPTVEALAAAEDGEVMTAWAGLGYYSRARNLIACARAVSARGSFPEEVAGLRALPGVGAYTAAAIAAIAFGRRAVPVDANVERVVARLFAVSRPLPAGKPDIAHAAESIAPASRHGDFAQALMDLGATVCTPRRPRCLACPLAADCAAYRSGRPEAFPVKAAKKPKPLRFGQAFWFERDGEVLLVRRPPRGMLGGMRALPDDGWSAHSDGSGQSVGAGRALGTVRHGFTHFDLELTVVAGADAAGLRGAWWPIGKLGKAGLPTLFAKAAARALEDAAAQAQPDDRDHQHDQAEIPPAVPRRQRADARAEDRNRQDDPVAPTEQRDGRGDRQEQRDEAEQDR